MAAHQGELRCDTLLLCRSGGKLDLNCSDPIRLRILLDGSVCEVFTSLGQVLTVRVNRCARLRHSILGGLAAGLLPADHASRASPKLCSPASPQQALQGGMQEALQVLRASRRVRPAPQGCCVLEARTPCARRGSMPREGSSCSGPGGHCPDIGFMSRMGTAKVSHVEVWGMDSCWDEQPDESDNTPCR